MKQIVIAVLVLVWAPLALASGGSATESVDLDLHNKASLQRGAGVFVNYCLSCHSAKFVRYQRIAQDLGLTEEQVVSNLIFSDAKIGDTMTVAAPSEQMETWFGVTPPDLSLAARARGADWIYSYLKGFYADPSRPFGVNNTQLQNAAMPHVLWRLQGVQELVDGHLELSEPGLLSEHEYDELARDLTAFLVYISEPAALVRFSLGVKVVAFLLLLLLVTYLLKREYWKDVH
ncbi:MAG: cytochrome c1 [Gammaproteobacteria bacterium]|nr:cytochrome c1 [Gammaproteobacteria bacterium]